MRLNDAKSLRKRNLHLIGKRYKDNYISDIIIVPANVELNKIFQLIIMNSDYSHLLLGHKEFNVIVLLDFEEASFTGLYMWELIQNVIDKT